MNQWTDRTTRAPAAAIDPYEDFETAIRPDGTDPAGLWHPVFIRLRAETDGTPGYTAAARRILRLQARKPDRVAMGADSLAVLHRLIAREAAGSSAVDHLRYLFIYRPTELAYDPLRLGAGAGGATVCDVVQVGVAVPRAAVDTTPLPEDSADTLQSQTLRPDIVVTAVIDDFIGIAHERFRAAPARTRLRHHWIQGIESIDPVHGGRPTVAIGQEFGSAEIDALLAGTASEPAFYRALDAELQRRAGVNAGVPGLKFEEGDYRRPIGFNETHGTHIMDLAGGAPMGTLDADARPLVGVELPALATIETNGARLDAFVLQAVQRILNWCDDWHLPAGGTARVGVVINLSYGITAGPKTGRGFLEREIARLLDARNAEGLPSKIVLPAGNSYRSHLTGAVSVTQGQARALDWRILPQDRSSSYLELRLPAAASCALTLTPPHGPAETVAMPAPGAGIAREWRRDGQVLGAIYAQPSPTEAGITRVILALGPSTRYGPGQHVTPAGAYGISLAHTGTGTDETSLDVTLDVQRDDTPSGFPIHGRQSYLEDAHIGRRDPVTKDYAAPHSDSAVKWTGSLSAYATHPGEHVFVVGGAYPDSRAPDATADRRDPARYGAAGPSRGANARNPDLAAVCEEGRMIGGMLAAGAFSGAGSVFSGTSSAAPQIARAIVDALQGGTAPDKAAILDAILGTGRPPVADGQLGFGLPRQTYLAEGRVARR